VRNEKVGIGWRKIESKHWKKNAESKSCNSLEKVGGQKVLGEKWRAESGNMEMFGTKSSTEN
jgi:hypothetical protein